MAGSVENKVVIVTGAARGIGAGIAANLVENGAKVVIADLNEETAKQTAAKISSVDATQWRWGLMFLIGGACGS